MDRPLARLAAGAFSYGLATVAAMVLSAAVYVPLRLALEGGYEGLADRYAREFAELILVLPLAATVLGGATGLASRRRLPRAPGQGRLGARLLAVLCRAVPVLALAVIPLLYRGALLRGERKPLRWWPYLLGAAIPAWCVFMGLEARKIWGDEFQMAVAFPGIGALLLADAWLVRRIVRAS